MTVRRLFAIAGIFLGTSAAWAILGASLVARSGEFDSRLEREVHALWGAPQRQLAATAAVDRPDVETEVVESKDAAGKVTRTESRKDVVRSHGLTPESTRAVVDVQLEHRQKGVAVVRHLRRPLPRHLRLPQPRRRRPDRAADAAVARGAGPVR